MKANSYVLAMYDVRGKQDYIFRGNKIKEIVGGSLVIRDIFEDELYPAARIYAEQENIVCNDSVIYKYDKKNPDEVKFSVIEFENHMNSLNGYLGEVVYDGGGNFFILYKNKEVYEGINKIFTRRVLEHTYSLTVLCSCIEGVDFNNYTTVFPNTYTEEQKKKYYKEHPNGDRERLYKENRKREARINPQMPAQVLPFTQVDYANSLPLYKKRVIARNDKVTKEKKITRESYRKYEKFDENKISTGKNDYNSDSIDEKILDKIVKEKGRDSWLAVIYIDGNNMGAKVQGIFAAEQKSEDVTQISYEEAINKLRKFSSEIQRDYIDTRIEAVDKMLKDKYNTDYRRRLVVYAGDEINIIVNAHDAYDVVKAYFKDMPENCSACAGIAIFKSHMPYADAYRIAEQCCESGKQVMKKYQMGDVNMMDFHYCQGVIGLDIEKIREREVGNIISKPWFVVGESQDKYMRNVGDIDQTTIITTNMIDEMVERLNTCSRTNIKGLLASAKRSESELFTELKRMEIRRKKEDAENYLELTNINDVNGQKLSKDIIRKMVYDIVTVYDLWFGKGNK